MKSNIHAPPANLHPVVFWVSTVIIFALLGSSLLAIDSVGDIFNQVRTLAVDQLGWLYIGATTGILLFAIWLLFSPYGDVRLGPDDSRPEFSRPTWFAMLFSAGMGIGLLFYSVAEPITHLNHPISSLPGSRAAAQSAMGLTFFHWGLHPWGVYAVVALALAYFSFRRGLPLSIRSALYPLFGDRIHGWIGDVVDVMAVVSTLFGVATSLGLGALQVNSGLNHVFGVSESTSVQLVIISCITAIATVSVVSGLDVGVRRLSEINMALAFGLLVFIFIAGPTTFLMGALIDNIGEYAQRLVNHSFWTARFESEATQEWLGDWTVFYWAWWISWAPFVGMFIARVSKGRTLREFMLAVLLAPSGAGFIWLTVFGDTALYLEVFGAGGLSEAVDKSVPTAVFVMLEQLPFSVLTGMVCTVCIILFFVTSSDSASLVIDTIASGGNEDPPIFQRIYWAVLEGVVASVLLYAGGLQALQAAAIATALPFTFVVILMCWSLVKGLAREKEESSYSKVS